MGILKSDKIQGKCVFLAVVAVLFILGDSVLCSWGSSTP